MASEPIIIGPTGWPERTIIEPVVVWCAKNLTQPDGPLAGQPWRFTKQQLQTLAHWFAHDEQGRWIHRRGTMRYMKGSGKDPIAAVLAMIELCGPSRVDPATLEAIRNAAPWVDIAAVARDQTRTTMRLFPQLVPERTREKYGLDINKEIIYAQGGSGVIQAVTSSPNALEGGRATLVIRNETQYWFKANSGHEMAEVIDGNLAKSRDGAGRAMSMCNAHVPGEDSVAEREWDAWQAVEQGRTRIRDILYASREAPADTKLEDEDSLRTGLIAARGDSTWIDVDRLIAEVWDPRTTPSEARRKYLNQIVAAEDSYIDPNLWKSLQDATLMLELGDQITLGFDGSKTGDHSGLVATRIDDGAEFVLGHWDPALSGGEIDRIAVDAAVASAFENYDVVAFYSDLHPFESYVDQWQREFGEVNKRHGLCLAASTKHTIAWDMRGRQRDFVRAAERVHAEVQDKRFRYAPHAGLVEHGINAHRRIDRHGVGFSKETKDSTRKVDLLAALMLSRLAYHDYLALPQNKKRKVSSGRAQFV